MSQNYKFSGKRITLSPAAPVASGALCRVKGFVGIPLTNRVAGESVAFALEGVWGMTYAAYGAYQPPVGTILYFNTSTGALSIGAANDDYAAVKVVTAVSATDGSFDGLLLPQGRPYGQEQS